jgi:hypothetical protein
MALRRGLAQARAAALRSHGVIWLPKTRRIGHTTLHDDTVLKIPWDGNKRVIGID